MYKINGRTVQQGIGFVGEHEEGDGFLGVAAAHPDLTDARHPPPAVPTVAGVRRQQLEAPAQVPKRNRVNTARRNGVLGDVKLFSCCVLYFA